MRCFIAIEIDEEIRGQIGRFEEELRRKTGLDRPKVKWVEPSNIHLTLKFLGQVRDQAIREVCGLVEEVVAEHESFEVEVSGLGVFGRPARVLWVGTGASEGLLSVQKDIEERFCRAGFGSDDKKFSGHLTLCRVKNPGAGRQLEAVIGEYRALRFGSFRVDSICVYKSELTSAGPVYTLISRSMLR
jgi:2'-5' RNA ligase